MLSASHREFGGDVLRIDASGARAAQSGAVLVRASAGGEDVFKIKVMGGGSGTLCMDRGEKKAAGATRRGGTLDKPCGIGVPRQRRRSQNINECCVQRHVWSPGLFIRYEVLTLPE